MHRETNALLGGVRQLLPLLTPAPAPAPLPHCPQATISRSKHRTHLTQQVAAHGARHLVRLALGLRRAKRAKHAHISAPPTSSASLAHEAPSYKKQALAKRSPRPTDHTTHSTPLQRPQKPEGLARAHHQGAGTLCSAPCR